MKKILVCFVTFLVLLCNFSENLFAEDDENVNKKTIKEDVIIPVPDSFITPDSISWKNDFAFAIDQYDPTSDMKDPQKIRYSPEKNTNDFGISWAAAICRSAESYYRISKLNKGDPFDLSEMHLAWFSYHTDGVKDILGNNENSGTITSATGTDVFNVGGNPIMATLAIANGIGFVDESKFPYKSSYTQTELNNFTNKANCYNPDYRLINSEWFSLKSDLDIKRAKKYIYSYGQLATYIHLDEEMINYELPNLLYYCDDEITSENKPNYGATIIGWNDNISADSFSSKDGSHPTRNGAWIVKCNYKDQNDDSYPNHIYISYDEASISNSFAASFEIEKVNDPEEFHVFQYDGNSGFNYATGYELLNSEVNDYKYETYFYNVYEPNMQEEIYNIGLFTYQSDLKASVYISYFDSDYNPTIDEMIEHSTNDLSLTLTIDKAGYHRYKLSYFDGIIFAYQGQKIYVLVKLSSKTNNIKIPLDSKTTDYSYNIKQTLGPTNNVYSYVKTANGVQSLISKEGAPAKIKLFTKPTPNLIYYIVDEDVTNPNSFEFFNEDVIGQELLPASKDKYEFYGWFTDEYFLDEKITHYPYEIEGDLYLYPAFCQKIIFDYEGNNIDITLNVQNYKTNGIADAINLPINNVKAPAGKEFAGWKYKNKDGVDVEITDFYVPYTFEGAKLNGDDIVCTPIWKTVTSDLPSNIVSENLVDNQVVFISTEKFSPGETALFSVDGNALKNKIQTNSDTALIWLESNKIDDNKFDDYKDFFAKENGKEAVTIFDINVFKQEKNEDTGTKVQELNGSIDIELDVSNNPDLMKAAESNNLLVSQIHNGKVTDPVAVTYNKDTKKIKFPVDKFSIFAFELKQPIESTNPSGESDNTDKTPETKTDTNTDNTNKSADTKQTPDPNFVPPNTGIY